MIYFQILFILFVLTCFAYYVYWSVFVPQAMLSIHLRLATLWDDLRINTIHKQLKRDEFELLGPLLSNAVKSTRNPGDLRCRFEHNSGKIDNSTGLKPVDESSFTSPQAKEAYSLTIKYLFAAGLLENPKELARLASLAVRSLFSAEAEARIEENKRRFAERASFAH
jgi:hypothetical protein